MSNPDTLAGGAVFRPADDPRAFRTALGRFATGVTVVTALSHEGPIGITANSFSSVSLDPALVLWSPAKASSRHDAFVAAQHFAVHVLGAEQRPICDAFVRSKFGFEGLSVISNRDNVPIIAGCLATFECKLSVVHDAGDHSIVIGEVERARERSGEPLIFASGAFCTDGLTEAKRLAG